MSGAQTSRDTLRKTLTHTGTTLNRSSVGTRDNVDLKQNHVDPEVMESPILTWTCPENFNRIQYAGGHHTTKFIPRSMEEVAGTPDDDTEVDLETDIQPIAGQPRIVDQPYPVVVAYNVTQDTELDVEDVDYAQNKVTLAEDPADGDEVKLYPVIRRGTIRYQVIDRFDTVVGNVSHFPTLVSQFADKNQNNRKTQLHLTGRAEIQSTEKIRVLMTSPAQIVWEDPDYPRGKYVSSIGQEADITV